MPRRILVADDEKQIVRVIRRALERAGYDVITAFDGQEALERVRDTLPDLVVLDIMMPHKDGFEVLREMKAQVATSLIPVVMLSARFADANPYPPHGEGTRYFQPHPNTPEYLFIKPFDACHLLAIVNRLLEAQAERPDQKAT